VKRDGSVKRVSPPRRPRAPASGAASATPGRHRHNEGLGIAPESGSLATLLESLQPHDHLCLIYESKEERRAAAIPFIAIGLKRGEKCMYVVDTSTTDDVRRYLAEEGIDVFSVEQSGQLAVLHETEAYTREGSFDPDRMIALLIEETEKAVASGYPALRVTGEMTWVLHGHPGSEKALEYEAKLNRDLFPRYPCLAICQYDRWQFDPEVIKGVIMTHPLLVRGNHIYRNFYYIPPDEFLSVSHAAREAQNWLNNLERQRQAEETLLEEKERYRALFEQSMDAIYIVATDGTSIEANQAWLDLFGYTHEDLATLNVADIYADPADRAVFLRRIGKTGFVKDEVRFKRKDGTVLDSERTVVPVKDGSGNVTAYQGIIRDITGRKRAEEALRQANEYLDNLFDRASAPIIVWDPLYRITRFNQAFERLAGRTASEVLGQSLEIIFPAASEENSTALIQKTVSGEQWEAVEVPILKSDGSVQTVLWSSATVFAPDGKTPVATIAQGLDITERKQSEESLRRSSERIREYAAHLERIREEERTGIARELHDQLGQALTAVKMDLTSLYHGLSKGQSVELEKVAATIRLVEATTDDVRRISSELRPGILDDLGLAAAMEWQLQQFQERTGIRCDLTACDSADLGRDRSTVLYRVFQELLTNVMRHAAAKTVRVTFERDNSRHVLTVADDGRGMPEDAANQPTSLGFVGIRERLAPFGGSLEIASAPGQGARVTIVVPVG
jgi:PAS domain S-box-containing protein